MALALSILAIVITVAAGTAAWRARAASHRLAVEMIHLRDRLASAETARHAAEERAASQSPASQSPASQAPGVRPPGEAPDERLRERLALVEGRLREVLERGVAPVVSRGGAADEDIDLRAKITRRLRRDGYERIAFLESAGDGSLLVEAERHGSTTKARAECGADGEVRLTALSSYRAFP